jgi:DNA-binding MarR family transcriptional regulator
MDGALKPDRGRADEKVVTERPHDLASELFDSEAISASEAVQAAELRAALRRFMHRSERIARASGLTPQHQTLLLMIKGAPDRSETSTVTELIERLRLAQSTVTELVNRAVSAGLVERHRSKDDHRVFELRLAPEGERRLARSFRDHREERQRLLEALSECRAVAGDRKA